MNYLGDFAVGGIVDFKWSTNAANGSSITRATNGTVAVYFGNDVGQITDGVTDTEDFDGVTGIHHCRIDLSQSSDYAAGAEFDVVLSGSTIDGQPVNAVLAHFSIERAGGVLALLKGANGLSAIKAQTAAIEVDTQDIQSRLPSALQGGRMDSYLAAAGLQADAVTEIQAGLASQASVDDLPTNAELATALGTADDAVLAQIALVKAKTDNLPGDPADASDIAAAFSSLSSQVTTVDGVVDAIKLVTDKLDTTLEVGDTDGNYQFTVLALENAPSGTGASAEAIADEVETRTIAGVTTVGTVNALANGAVSAAALATDAVTEIADGILARDIGSGTNAGSSEERTVRSALRILRNKWTIDSDGLQTINKEDDTTPAWTQQLATDASATPVVGTDPAGP